MFRLLLLIVSLLPLTAVASQPADTVRIINDASAVSIVQKPDGMVLTVNGESGNPRSRYVYETTMSPADTTLSTIDIRLPFSGNENRRKAMWSFTTFGLYIGASVPVSAPAGLKTGYEGGWASLLGVRFTPTGQGFSIAAGVGLGVRITYSGRGHLFENIGRGQLVLTPAAEGLRGVEGYISDFRFHFPLVFRQTTWKDGSIMLGAYFNLNTYTTAETRYRIDDREYKLKFKGLHQRCFTVDLVGAIEIYDGVGIYVNYSPMNPFMAGKGPDYKSISAGLILGI